MRVLLLCSAAFAAGLLAGVVLRPEANAPRTVEPRERPEDDHAARAGHARPDARTEVGTGSTARPGPEVVFE